MCTDATPDCVGIGATFPANRRYAKIAAGDLVNRPQTTVHEIGHTLWWPHSYSGITTNEYDNPIDVMSGNAAVLGTPPYVELDPYLTLSYNRFQSGWVAASDVVIADGGTQTVTLQPFNFTGTTYVFKLSDGAVTLEESEEEMEFFLRKAEPDEEEDQQEMLAAPN